MPHPIANLECLGSAAEELVQADLSLVDKQEFGERLVRKVD